MPNRNRRRRPHRQEPTVPIGTPGPHPCADCGKRLILRRSVHGVFYSCEAYPACRGAHGAHPNGQPLGVPATREVKMLRIQVHDLFDPIWRNAAGTMTRSTAYRWFAGLMGLEINDCHVGSFDKEQCERAIRLLKQHHQAEGPTNADL